MQAREWFTFLCARPSSEAFSLHCPSKTLKECKENSPWIKNKAARPVGFCSQRLSPLSVASLPEVMKSSPDWSVLVLHGNTKGLESKTFPDPVLSWSTDSAPLCLETSVCLPYCPPGNCMISQAGSEPSLKGVGSIRETQMKTQWAPSHKSPSLGIAEQTKEEMPEYLLLFCWWQATKHQGSREIVFSCGKGRQRSSRGRNTLLATAGYPHCSLHFLSSRNFREILIWSWMELADLISCKEK